MFQWNEGMVAYMDRAARHTRYYQTLAEQIGTRLGKNDRICDAGCGLGYLSLALAEYVGTVEAVDVSEEALDILRSNCAERFNIRPIHADIHTWETAPYDAMVFCYFGRMEQIIEIARRLCKGRLYIIKGRSSRHLFSKDGECTWRETADMAAEWMQAQGIAYEETQLDLELGQPFLSRADAERFATLYGGKEGGAAWISNQLGEDPAGKYAWYLPIAKPVTIFCLENKNFRIGE